MFDANLYDWADGRGPMLTLNIPDYFETDDGVYEGDGLVSAPLKDVLEEYLTEFEHFDGGEAIGDFVSWLHDYAYRLEVKAG